MTAVRFVQTASLVALAALLMSASAEASPYYPATVVQQLDITCAGDAGVPSSWGCAGSMPGCLLCHNSCNGGPGTATQPFAMNMESYGLTEEEVPSLDTALTQMADNDVFSASHCLDDVDTMKLCKNPNAVASLDAGYCPKVSADGGAVEVKEDGGVVFTYGGHPVAAAVALKTIEIYKRRDVVGHVRHVAPLFLKLLALVGEHPLVGEAKGVGLIAGIELVADKQTKRAFDPAKGVAQMLGTLAEQEGLIVRPLLGDRFALCPPLVITEDEIAELFDRLGKALDKTLDWAKKELLLP